MTKRKMQVQKGKCKDKKENARTTWKAISWIASSKSSDQKQRFGATIWCNYLPTRRFGDTRAGVLVT